VKPFELREFSTDELKQKLHDLREELMSIRFKQQAETPKPSDIKKLKREIARVKTIMREKEIIGDRK